MHTVVIGQDPYPEVQRATGRAFEDWGVPELDFSPSLKRLLQSALTCQNPGLNADQNDTGWQEIREEVTAQLANRQAMTAYFDRLAAQGVLFLNAAWTCSAVPVGLPKTEKDRISSAHRVFWRPVMQKLIADLAALEQPIAFILLGKTAQNLLSGIEGVFRHSAVVPNNHPGRPAYFGDNPFCRLNAAQEQLAGAEIQWWAPQELPPAGPNVGGDP
ncbi:hypothetical protein BYZ73_08305 [Rhodovulum viride]|uniref:Uracil-DNA glycosylase n=1 Tax=Rhodovulum viride TaxID=1231134 RepID=A0ABX9DIH8_9RHOB|nr:hypothetical protein BYZ73_08305 [Rhodovulum viride]